jgi:hypothetical protein
MRRASSRVSRSVAEQCDVSDMSAIRGIVLQKSRVAGLQIFRKNTKRKAIADSYNFYRVTEVAYEFNVRR